MMQKGRVYQIIIILSIIAVLLTLILCCVFSTQDSGNDQTGEANGLVNSSLLDDSMDESTGLEKEESFDENNRITQTADETPKSNGQNASFEEEEAIEEEGNSSNFSAASGDSIASSIDEESSAEQDTPDQETSNVLPKAPQQKGEWGNPTKN